MIALKRAYDPISRSDGQRVLVERLWPRGLSKAKLHVDQWLKEVVRPRPAEMGHVSQALRQRARLPEGRMEADYNGGSPRACDADLQLARHGTQQCGRLAAVPATEDAETSGVNV